MTDKLTFEKVILGSEMPVKYIGGKESILHVGELKELQDNLAHPETIINSETGKPFVEVTDD